MIYVFAPTQEQARLTAERMGWTRDQWQRIRRAEDLYGRDRGQTVIVYNRYGCPISELREMLAGATARSMYVYFIDDHG